VSDPHDVVAKAVTEVAQSLGIHVDPTLVAQFAGLLVGLLAGRTWADAERAGVERAAKVTSLESADAAGSARR